MRTAPTEVTVSFWLWIASVVLSAIAVIVSLATGSAPQADLGGDTESARIVWTVAGIAGLVIGGGLRMLCAVYMRRGRPWARTVLLILAILTVFGSTAAILTGSFFDLLAIIAILGATVLMYVGRAGTYFRA